MKTVWSDGTRDREVTLTPLGQGRYRVRVDDNAEFEVQSETLADGRLRLTNETTTTIAEVSTTGPRRFIRLGNLDFVLDHREGARRRAGGGTGSGLEAPMPGLVTRVMVSAGDTVKKGQALVALEAMKMEHVIRAPRDGRVKALTARPGEMASPGAPLVELDEAS